MDASKYSRSATMLCPTCGNTDFEHDGDNSPLRCGGCDRVFEREELIRENGEIIEARVVGKQFERLAAQILLHRTKTGKRFLKQATHGHTRAQKSS